MRAEVFRFCSMHLAVTERIVVQRGGYVTTSPAQFDGARMFHDGLAWVLKGSKIGFIDATGKLVIDASFDEADDFSEGLPGVSGDGVRRGTASVGARARRRGKVRTSQRRRRYDWGMRRHRLPRRL